MCTLHGSKGGQIGRVGQCKVKIGMKKAKEGAIARVGQGQNTDEEGQRMGQLPGK